MPTFRLAQPLAALAHPRRSLMQHWLPWVAAAGTLLSWLPAEHFPPWVSWHGEALAFLTVFLVAVAALVSRLRSPAPAAAGIGLPWVAVPLICIPLVAFLQGLAGRIPFAGDVLVITLYAALALGAIVLGFHAAVAGMGTPDRRVEDVAALLAATLLAGAAASAVIALAQFFDVWHSPLVNRMHTVHQSGGNIGQPNQLATLLLMGMAALVFFAGTRRLGPWASALLYALLAGGLAAAGSRTGLVSFLVLASWWLLKRRSVSSSTPVWAGVLAVLAFLFLFLSWPAILGIVWFDLGTSSRLTNVSEANNLRLVVWPQLLEASFLKPWFGWGLLQVAEAHNAVVHTARVSEPYSYAHNVVLDIAVGMGWPITLISIGAAGIWLRRRVTAAHTPVSWLCIALVLTFGTHAMLEFPHAYAYFLVPVLFAVGLLEASIGTKPALTLRAWPIAAAVLGTGAVLLWSAVEYLRIEEDFRVVRFEALRIGETPADYERPKVLLFTQLGGLLAGARIDLRPQMPSEELEQLRRLALRYPWAATQYRYAVALALNGDMDEAVRQLKVLSVQRGPSVYLRTQRVIDHMAQTRYPQLRNLRLP